MAARPKKARNTPKRTTSPPRPARRTGAVANAELDGLIGYALRRAQLKVFEDFYAALSVAGITPARFSALILIDANPGIGQTVLARSLNIARSGVVTLADTLESLGLVTRDPIAGDKRAYALNLTPAGRGTLKRVRDQVQVHEARVCAKLTKAEKALLLEMLARVG